MSKISSFGSKLPTLSQGMHNPQLWRLTFSALLAYKQVESAELWIDMIHTLRDPGLGCGIERPRIGSTHNSDSVTRRSCAPACGERGICSSQRYAVRILGVCSPEGSWAPHGALRKCMGETARGRRWYRQSSRENTGCVWKGKHMMQAWSLEHRILHWL